MSSKNNNGQHENRSGEEVRISREILGFISSDKLGDNQGAALEAWSGTTDRSRQADILAAMLISVSEKKLEAMILASYPMKSGDGKGK